MVRKLNIDGDAHDTTQEAAMSTNVVRSIDTSVARVDLKFEAVVIPVSDVDRAKEFYKSLGWRLDADFRFDNGFRIVQFTPPGSGCSTCSCPFWPRPRCTGCAARSPSAWAR